MKAALLKLLGRFAIGSVPNEDSRRTLFTIILTVLIVFLIIVVGLVYIITSPLSFIVGFFVSGEDKEALNEFKAEYYDAVVLEKGVMIFNGDYPMPVVGEITSGYGPRIHPITGQYSFHSGIDIGSVWHADVIAIADGQVVDVDISDASGNYVLIKHSNFYTFYAHLSDVFVLQDHEVFQGDIIGAEGGDPLYDPFPGQSTGHHLHFEIRNKEKANSHVDPIPYLFTPPEPEEEEEDDPPDERKGIYPI